MGLDPLRIANYVLYIALAALAVAVWRREPSHRAFAAYVVWMTASDWGRLLLAELRESAARPYTGLARVWFHLDEALVLSWSFGLLAVTLLSFARWRPWTAALGWAVAMAVCLDYPDVRGETLQVVYRTSALLCLGTGIGCVFWGILVRRDLQPRLHHLAVMAFLAADSVIYLLPYVKDMFGEWSIVRTINTVLLLVLCALHARALVRPHADAPLAVDR